LTPRCEGDGRIIAQVLPLCVEMKSRTQRGLLEEYERRKGEFSSYADFINPSAQGSEEIGASWDKVSRSGPAVPPASRGNSAMK